MHIQSGVAYAGVSVQGSLASGTDYAYSAHQKDTNCNIHHQFTKNFHLCFLCGFGDRIWNLRNWYAIARDREFPCVT